MNDVLGEVEQSLKGKKGRAAVVIFSDGLPQEAPSATEASTTESAKQLIENYSGEVCIHTVHLGDDEGGARYLALLASLTSCGSSRTFADVKDPKGFMGFTREVFTGAAAAVAKVPDACEGRIVLRGVEFAFDRAEIAEISSLILDFAATQMNQCPNISVEIQGHTDGMGSDDYNQNLGQRRAESVRSYFVSKGVGASRLTARSLGESQPVASNSTPEGRQMNRRVELHPKK
jgi:OOP family OmpA-OmpF porin